MYYENCEWYVNMGEYNKPLCKKSGYRPAECELCPTRVASLEAENASLRGAAQGLGELCDRYKAENAKLREMIAELWECCAWETNLDSWCEECDHQDTEEGGCRLEKSLRELGIKEDE